jgi:putative alpha-1,2-mannosidase
MESWILWAMLGLYPVTGQTTFLIGSPWFSDIRIALHSGSEHTLRITTTGGAETSYYVQSLRVNGRAWDRAWVAWDDVFARGGTLDFVLGPDPVVWATGDAPPSPASSSVIDENDDDGDAEVGPIASRVRRHGGLT